MRTPDISWDQELSDEILQIEGSKRDDPEKVREYFVTTIGGLEEVALRDLKAHLKSIELIRVEPGRRYGRIIFRYDRSPARLLKLRSVENIFVLLCEVVGITPGRPGLLRAAKQVAACDLVPAVALHDTLHGAKAEHGFHLTCTVGKDHRFSVSELYQVLDTVLSTKYDVYTEDVPAPYRLHFRTGRKRAVFGLQLSDRRLGKRDYLVKGVPGDLNASIAYTMAILGGVQSRDVCLDPFCRDPATLMEAGLGFGSSELAASTTEGASREQLKATMSAVGLDVQFASWKGARIDLPDQSVDKILTDLRSATHFAPFERICGQMISEFARVLRPRRRAVLLTADEQAVRAAVVSSEGQFEIQKRLRINLRGLRPSIFVLKRV